MDFEAALRPGRAARSGKPRTVKLAELDRAVYAYLDLTARLGLPPQLPKRASGAVALGRAAAAPTEIRAVIFGHSLRATDADWEFGRGPCSRRPPPSCSNSSAAAASTPPAHLRESKYFSGRITPEDPEARTLADDPEEDA